MGIRRKAREAALQLMFMQEYLDGLDEERIDFSLEHFSVFKEARDYAKSLCLGVSTHIKKIDSVITCASQNWSVSRMSRVDRAILRIATYELCFLDEVPLNVVINEAIEIAKRYGSDESANFINGVLDRVAEKEVRQEKVAAVK